MLNLSPDHLDRHGDMAGYTQVKRAVFARQHADDVAVVGIDDADSRAMADAVSLPRVVRISGDQPADVWADGRVLRDASGVICDLRTAAALPGTHNGQNAAAAAALATALGIGRDAIASGIASYPGLPHRQERVGSVDGVLFVNDSKATNADSTARALACYDRVVWIAGGMQKAGGITSLVSLFPQIAHAFLIGRDAAAFAETLTLNGVAFTTVGTLENAVPAAFAAARAGAVPVVLLSPACASFDQFSGFEARGDRFRALVGALQGGG
jgi:UDP-N-acetylmuramoylalanine--D-glutamate ligase